MSKNYPTAKKGGDDCFSGSLDETLVQIKNPPGLSYLRYRIGTHRTFKENMLASLSSTLVTGFSPDSDEKPTAPLKSLTTRGDDDLIVSLFDAWATVADVLTFYQERIANEGYLRTSTDRRSILELGRAVGYELGPGVAANTFLAFTLDESPETTQKRTIIAKGIKVQSVPAQGELPQIFETIEEIEADPEWNELRPRLTEPQIIDENTKRLYLQKIDAQIKQGNKLLVQLTRDNSYILIFELIDSDVLADENLELPYIHILQQSLLRNDTSGSSAARPNGDERVNTLLRQVAATFDVPDPQYKMGGWSQNDLVAFAVTHQLPRKKFFELFNYHAQSTVHDQVRKNHVYSFKLRASLFGHNAPAFRTLSEILQEQLAEDWGHPPQSSPPPTPPAWSWDSDGKANQPITIENYFSHVNGNIEPNKLDITKKQIYLDNVYPGIIPSNTIPSWIVLEPAKPVAVGNAIPGTSIDTVRVQIHVQIGSGHNLRAGQILLTVSSILYNQVLCEVDVSLAARGDPQGNVTLNIRRGSDDAIAATLGTYDVSQLSRQPGTFQTINFVSMTNQYALSIGDKILVEYNGGGPGAYLEMDTSTTFDVGGSGLTHYVSSYVRDKINKAAMTFWTKQAIPYKVSTSSEITLADFTLSTKVTALLLGQSTSADPSAAVPQAVWSDFFQFKLRETTVYAQSNELELSPDRPYNYDGTSTELSLQDNIVILDHVVDGLKIGQPISIIGALVDSPKDIRTEIAFIDDIDLSGDKHHTKLHFKEKLANKYDVKTLKLNANVSRATHGETKQEVIGSSDPSKSQQEFVLKQKPLTYTSSAGKKGVNTTLEVFVDGVKWNEVPALSNLRQDEHGYIVRTDNEGTVHIIFGAKGARPPAGIENVKAKYRIGIGKSGLLKENQLKLLVDRPLGIRSVTNPTKPTDGDDPEDISSARQNASISATHMGRLISAGDFENFAQSFMGIGNAKAVQTWDGKETVVHITVASASGNAVDPGSNLFSSLAKAISDSKDPRISFYLDTFTPKSFSLEANVQVTPDRDPKVIQSEIEDQLHAEFAYTSRQFGQSVTKNDIVVAIQRIEGVIMVDVKNLYESNKHVSKDASKDAITCNIAYWDNYNNKFVRSELLTIHPDSGQNAVYVTVYVAGESLRR